MLLYNFSSIFLELMSHIRSAGISGFAADKFSDGNCKQSLANVSDTSVTTRYPAVSGTR